MHQKLRFAKIHQKFKFHKYPVKRVIAIDERSWNMQGEQKPTDPIHVEPEKLLILVAMEAHERFCLGSCLAVGTFSL